ncbi:hypothetical protein ADUPG1_013558 [Aduncisulcus paluster]|nr:hypothetical protein ADUPG1_011551 [Aduncisulcus paluster]GKT26980.1 hypothetical protein ADUPG1_013558 [Aduncisulcus paluster]
MVFMERRMQKEIVKKVVEDIFSDETTKRRVLEADEVRYDIYEPSLKRHTSEFVKSLPGSADDPEYRLIQEVATISHLKSSKKVMSAIRHRKREEGRSDDTRRTPTSEIPIPRAPSPSRSSLPDGTSTGQSAQQSSPRPLAQSLEDSSGLF